MFLSAYDKTEDY